jgi:hypothetical protein
MDHVAVEPLALIAIHSVNLYVLEPILLRMTMEEVLLVLLLALLLQDLVVIQPTLLALW